MTQVSLVHLTKSYAGNQKAVDDLSLDIPDGKLTALLGPSGCGKTTVLKMIAGLLQPTSGDILFDGASTLRQPAERRGAVMVFQRHLLFPYMTVAENVAFGLKVHGEKPLAIRQKVRQMLELVQLAEFEHRKPSQLSGGQQQRVALARALIVQPRVLLLDEPLSNLDTHLRDEMRDLILNLQREKAITTVFVTHDQEEAVIMADQLALILGGVLQQVDAPRVFYERPATERVARFFGANNIFPGMAVDGLIETAFGKLRMGGAHLPTGEGQLVIRPEAVVIDASGIYTENIISGIVRSCIYSGTRTRLRIHAGEMDFEVSAEAGVAENIQKGDLARLYLPPDRLWFIAS